MIVCKATRSASAAIMMRPDAESVAGRLSRLHAAKEATKDMMPTALSPALRSAASSCHPATTVFGCGGTGGFAGMVAVTSTSSNVGIGLAAKSP